MAKIRNFEVKMKQISLAHSPDADDIFMYSAIKFGWCNAHNLKFQASSADIQTLNTASLRGEYDICAISFGLYPLICDEYALLRTALSFGQGYGPKLIKRKGQSLKANFKVALSGQNTTNALLFRIAFPKARVIYKNFLEIENAVLSKECDAGVLIHESILDFNDELCVEMELWDLWQELASDSLPLPLGGMCLRRSLPLSDAINCEKLLTQAVSVANSHKKMLSKMLMERNLVRVNDEKLDIYLSLYANQNSVELSQTQIKALDKLFYLGFKHGFFARLITCQPNLIPREYMDYRNS